MRHIHEEARRHAYNTLAEVNRHLSDPQVTKSPQRHHMLTDMKEKATRTIENLGRMDERMDYQDTNIGFNWDDDTEMRRRGHEPRMETDGGHRFDAEDATPTHERRAAVRR